MKLTLGTVQFGLDYGVANASGQVMPAEIAAILTECRASGITMLDTAIGYGESETRLGRSGVTDMQIVTKLPAVPKSCADIAGFVRTAVKESMSRLKVKNLYALLLHQATDLTGENASALYKAMREIQSEGQANKIGVSIYSPDILETITNNYALDLVQAPFNVFDQRMVTSNWLARVANLGIEVHTRSAFLQGLLLVPAGQRPACFTPWAAQFKLWDDYLATNKLTPLQGALGFVSAFDQIDRIVIGVDNVSQLRAITNSVKTNVPKIPLDIACDDLTLIDPSTWSSN